MPQKVLLERDGEMNSVIVRAAHLSDDVVRLEGFDPSFCPDGMEDGITFVSKDLTAIIESDSSVSVVSVAPTAEGMPEPDVSF